MNTITTIVCNGYEFRVMRNFKLEAGKMVHDGTYKIIHINNQFLKNYTHKSLEDCRKDIEYMVKTGPTIYQIHKKRDLQKASQPLVRARKIHSNSILQVRKVTFFTRVKWALKNLLFKTNRA